MSLQLDLGTHIYGLLSEMEGLQEFMSTGSTRTGFGQGVSAKRMGSHHATTSLEITVREVPHMVVRMKRGRRMGTQGIESGPDSVVLESLGPSRTISEFLETHRPIEALLAVAFWRETRIVCRQVILRREVGGADGSGTRSHDLLTYGEAQESSVEATQPGPMFRYTDGSARMFDTWSTIWDEKPRAIRPFTNLPGIHGALPQTRLLIAGTGLEALGYYLALDESESKQSAKDEPLAAKLDQVVDSLPDAMRELLGEEVTKSFRDAYMAVKHADCAMPPSQEIHDAYAWGVSLFRLWTASQLGVPASACVSDALALP